MTIQVKPIRKLLVANRGEIALRILKTCKKLCIHSVAVHSSCDKNEPFVLFADEAICIGGPLPAESYLNMSAIINAALQTNSDAIHPGYGFLSENPQFAEECERSGIIFIGPSPESIRTIGDKSSAKSLLQDTFIPLIPGYNGDDQEVSTLVSQVQSLGFPVLLKASAGGGGKGMRIITDTSSIQESIERAKSEAMKSFGNEKLLIEKYFEHVKHVEVQILGDNYGNLIHCFERDCSIQRRHQKVIEETPCITLDNTTRQKMMEAAIAIGKMIKYQGAGTVEFILDVKTNNFYFLEVNTRLQVEHPITEAVTGLDLVELQIKIAMGYPISELVPSNIQSKGHAIECRLCAEDSETFLPSIGRVLKWKECHAPNTRYDSGIVSGCEVTIFYDSLISKIIVHGPNRSEAIRIMEYALKNTVILGLSTNKAMLLRCLGHPLFKDNFNTNTQFLQTYICNERESFVKTPSVLEKDHYLLDCLFAMAGMCWNWQQRQWKKSSEKSPLWHIPSGYRNVKYGLQHTTMIVKNDRGLETSIIQVGYLVKPSTFSIKATSMNEVFFDVILFQNNANQSVKESQILKIHEVKKSDWKTVQLKWCLNEEVTEDVVNGQICIYYEHNSVTFEVSALKSKDDDKVHLWMHSNSFNSTYQLMALPRTFTNHHIKHDTNGEYITQMPCRILKMYVTKGDKIKQGDALWTMESMKMEITQKANSAGIISDIFVEEGQVVEAGVQVMTIEENPTLNKEM